MKRTLYIVGALVGAVLLWLWWANMNLRERVVKFGRALLGIPYLWGGDSPSTGLDCSGFAIYVLGELGVVPKSWQRTHTADRMFRELPPTTTPKPGDLAFYGSASHVSHVMMVTDSGGVIGASGGDQTTTSKAAAEARGAAVKEYSSPTYRKDLVGFRTWPKEKGAANA